MHKTLDALIRLTRYKEYLWFVVVTTLLGVAAANGTFSLKLIIVLIANWLAVGFSFMINDVEDAADDALNPAKVNRNPVSAKILSPRTAYVASFAVMILSGVMYALLGTLPFIIGLISLTVGFLYSWQRVRLKSMPFVDLITHCMMLAGFQFLPAYFTFTSTLNDRWLWPFLAVTSISMYGELFNELRDLTGDLEAGVKHTASVLGQRATQILANILLALGVIALFITLFFVALIPVWVLIVMALLALILIVPPLLRVRRSQNMVQLQGSFQVPLTIAAAAALVIGYLAPWLNSFFHFGIF
ncbi:MAG TPA: UbiA prenyltransferase family protein [Anaerolineae bacterium]|nr:UbiA prenyltransferase family protein [Anaerolineae bacterium]